MSKKETKTFNQLPRVVAIDNHRYKYYFYHEEMMWLAHFSFLICKMRITTYPLKCNCKDSMRKWIWKYSGSHSGIHKNKETSFPLQKIYLKTRVNRSILNSNTSKLRSLHFLLRYKWHITLCKFKVYNVILIHLYVTVLLSL